MPTMVEAHLIIKGRKRHKGCYAQRSRSFRLERNPDFSRFANLGNSYRYVDANGFVVHTAAYVLLSYHDSMIKFVTAVVRVLPALNEFSTKFVDILFSLIFSNLAPVSIIPAENYM